jgi:type I restriction enzyme S subunit
MKAAARAAGAGRYKPYPAYKDSGVEWLGEIPADWEVKRLKYLATLNPESLMEDTDPTREMIYVDIGGVDSLGHIIEREQLTFASAPSRARRLVRDGDVIVSTVRTYLRAIAPISNPEPGTVVSTGFAVVRPADDLTTDYAAYGLRAPYFVERVVANSKGVSFPAINESEMATYELASPPGPEQRAIAAFLDQKTARIDALVVKKERLIALLQEQRAALITRAVTKGLPSTGSGQATPTVPMKDSGVEWLGEIPAHWVAKHLRWAIMFQRGHDLPTDEREDGEVPVVSSSGTSSSHSRAVAKAPGIVTGRYGTIGCFHLIMQDYWPLNTTLYSIDLRGNDPHFLQYMLTHLSPLFLLNAVKSAVPGVDRNDIHPTRTAVPPLHEQRAIAAFLDRETARIDALVAKVREAINRLKELRTALISAAVTGKIDVRGEVA